MTNTAKRRGTDWEVAIRDLAIRRGFNNAHRLAQGGTLDVGDLWLHPELVIEAKATSRLDLAAAVKEAKQEAETAGARWWFAAIKRRNHQAANGYAVTELGLMLDLVGAVLLEPPYECTAGGV